MAFGRVFVCDCVYVHVCVYICVTMCVCMYAYVSAGMPVSVCVYVSWILVHGSFFILSFNAVYDSSLSPWLSALLITLLDFCYLKHPRCCLPRRFFSCRCIFPFTAHLLPIKSAILSDEYLYRPLLLRTQGQAQVHKHIA